MCVAKRVCEDKLVAKIAKVQKYRGEVLEGEKEVQKMKGVSQVAS